jgi:hypothetical protein
MQYSFSKFFSMQLEFGCCLIKGREEKNKESGDSSVNGYLRLQLTCLLLLEASFMQVSGVNLTLIWPRRLCLLRVLLCRTPLLQAFPFLSTLGEVTLHPLS